MTFPSLPSDFFDFESRLTGPERDLLLRLRAWLDETVRPVADDLWERGAMFGPEVHAGLAELGIYGLAWEETRPFPNSAVFRGWVALELNHRSYRPRHPIRAGGPERRRHSGRRTAITPKPPSSPAP